MTTRCYWIRVKGQLGPEWSQWFEGLTVSPQANGETLLSGPVADEAALLGLLVKAHNLGLPLVALSKVAADDDG